MTDPASEYSAPQSPGVYIMKGDRGRVLYVGKAVNLRARVNQYLRFQDSRAMVPRLVEALRDIEYVVTQTEKEALLLESHLIKRLKPPFNIRLRDDKSFLLVRVDRKSSYPRFELVRKRKKDGATYFGPYSSAGPLREYVRFLTRAFQLCTCKERDFAQRSRPCMRFQMGWCTGPCTDKEQEEDYRRRVEAALDLLTRKRGDAATRVQQAMEKAAEEERFEEAARYRDLLQSLNRLWAKQNVEIKSVNDADVFGHFEGPLGGALFVMHVRDGTLAATRSLFHEGLAIEGREMDALICRFYEEADAPPEVLCDLGETEGATVSQVLAERFGRGVAVVRPQRGEKRGLVEMADKNAKQVYTRESEKALSRFELMRTLALALSLPDVPAVVECVDISVFQGSDAVGAVSVARDGVPVPGEYRMFHVRGDTTNDFVMMEEVVRRRVEKLKDSSDTRLVLVDGGKAHLARVLPLFADLDPDRVFVAAIAKARPEQGLDADRVFLPGGNAPAALEPTSPVMHFLMQLRDEAHRFGITFHRKKRSKRHLVSPLLSVPGMGPKRRLALLRHFGSYDAASHASVEQLRQVPGLPDAMADALHAFFQGRK